MNGFCPNCEADSPLELVRKSEEFKIRGESIPVDVEYYHCQECGEEFENSKSSIDPYEIAYREYRLRIGLLQPEEIHEFRNQHGLTQKEFSDLIGIGIATLNRYENGALQSEAHDRVIRLIMEPRNFINLITNSQGILGESKKSNIIDELTRVNEFSFFEAEKQAYGSYQPDLFSGYKSFDLEKFFESIKFFCFQDRVFKTKLMKLLFYADFGHFKDYSVSITGTRYARLPHGPVPDQFERWLVALTSNYEAIQKEEVWKGDYPGEVFISNVSFDSSIFSPSEIKILASVKEIFKDFTAKQIKEASHLEKGYQETENAKLISYRYAAELKFDF